MFLLRFLLLRSSVEAETKWAARPFEKQLFMFPKDGYYAQKPSLSTTNDSAPRPCGPHPRAPRPGHLVHLLLQVRPRVTMPQSEPERRWPEGQGCFRVCRGRLLGLLINVYARRKPGALSQDPGLPPLTGSFLPLSWDPRGGVGRTEPVALPQPRRGR